MPTAQSLADQLAAIHPRRTAKKMAIWKTRLKDVRKEKHLTLDTASKAIGISLGHLCAIELGKNDVPLTTARKIADFYGCTVEYLWPERA